MSAFSVLAREALRDAARRRGLVAAAVASAIAGLAIARCGHCEANIAIQGETLSSQTGDFGGAFALAGVALIALWTYAVAALLASDGLSAAIEDGVAEAVLARPVSRDAFVLARLAGAWLGAFALGAALLALALGLSADRPGPALLPAMRAVLAVGVAAWSVAALAMVVSLSLPRAATLLLFGALGTAVVAIEVAALLGARMGGLAGAVACCGPAWLASPVGSLSPWLSELRLPGPPQWPDTRALAWAALATGALVARFRRIELPR
jgi:ABC-type transport system involved in multi-copper enzyme maturation permease subunit